MERQQAFIDYYITHHCDHGPANKEQHIKEEHLNNVLDTCVKPFFPVTTVMVQHDRARPVRSTGPTDDWNPPWKDQHHGFTAVDVLEWFIQAASAGDLVQDLPKLIPPLLRIMDDPTVEYKLCGVTLLRKLIARLPATIIVQYGLDSVWMDSLFRCLSYMTDNRDFDLLNETYGCLMELILKTNPAASQKRDELLHKVLMDGIVVGLRFAGHKSNYVGLFLDVLVTLVVELDASIVPYINVCLDAIHQGTHGVDVQLNFKALILLQHVMQVAWPRVPFHGPSILEILVTVWLTRMDGTDPESQQLCQQAKDLFNKLQCYCQHQKQFEANIQALKAMNPDALVPLFNA
ncbi:hypothetical protein DM01DRAFT_1336768, partial [Hesseltinella vesiculosa]